MKRLRQRLGGERGATTVAEVAVACFLVGIVTALIVGPLTSMVKAAAKVEERSIVNVDLRSALEIIERDLRAANPIDALPIGTPVSTYRDEVSFTVFCADAADVTCGSDHRRAVTYRRNGTTLERVEGATVQRLIGPSGPSALPPAQQRGAIVNPADRPVFRYFDVHGTELQTLGAGASPSTHFRDCTISVRVDLVAVVEAGATPVIADLTTNGTLRNFHEVDGC